jgi:hypothetical protein
MAKGKNKTKQVQSGSKVALPNPSKKSRAERKRQPAQPTRAQMRAWEAKIGALAVPGFGNWEGGSLVSRGNTSATVGLAEYKENVQVELPRVVRKNGARDVWRGTEYLISVDTAVEGHSPGDILATVRMNPSVLSQTRIAEISKLYQRYIFTKATVHFMADANATESGSVIGFFSYDVDHPILEDEPLNVKLAAAQYRQRPSKVWQSRSFPFGKVDSFTNLFVNPSAESDSRLVYQGDWYLFAATELGSIGALGTIYLEYEIEFDIPTLSSVPEEGTMYTATGGTTVADPAVPFGDVVSTNTTTPWPSNNIEVEYSEATNSFIFPPLYSGLYLLHSSANARFTNKGIGAYDIETTWTVSSGDALFGNGTPTITQVNGGYTDGTGVDISPFRNSFYHALTVGSYGSITLQCVLGDALVTGIDYSGPITMRFIRVLEYGVGNNATWMVRKKLGSSRVYHQNIGKREQACLAIQRKRTQRNTPVTITKRQPEARPTPAPLMEPARSCSCCCPEDKIKHVTSKSCSLAEKSVK